MKLTILDRSIYFKGLLLLIKRDNIIAEEEKLLMTKIGRALGFDESFIKGAINDLLENEYLTDDVPQFSQRAFAESFILDGLKLAFSDNEFSAEELEHLTNIATKNGIDKEWLMMLIAKYIKHSENLNSNELLFVSKYIKDEEIRDDKRNSDESEKKEKVISMAVGLLAKVLKGGIKMGGDFFSEILKKGKKIGKNLDLQTIKCWLNLNSSTSLR